MTDNALLVTKQLADAYNQKDWQSFAGLLDPSAVYEGPDAESGDVERHEGIDAILEFMQDWSTIIPDDTATFIDSQLIDDDTVHCKVVWSGTRTGSSFVLRGATVPANGHGFTIQGSTTYKVLNGKIVQITDRFMVNEFLAAFGIGSE